MKIEEDEFPNKKDKYFFNNTFFIEEEWFTDVNLTDSATFPLALIKVKK